MEEVGVKIIIEISELAGYSFKVDGKKTNWEDMTRQQQIYVLNAFSQGSSLFRRFLKEEDE